VTSLFHSEREALDFLVGEIDIREGSAPPIGLLHALASAVFWIAFILSSRRSNGSKA
jgi:threonine/homoserine efflux transporter RhtA